MTPPRIALGSIFVECNEFGGKPTNLASFRQYQLLYGDEVLQLDQGTIGGMLAVLRENQAEVAPLLAATSCSGGAVTAACYEGLKRDLLARLSQTQPVAGVLLALHGSGVVAGLGDLEGDLLGAVRAQVGESIPVVATLDLHAHVTAAMVENADALIAWETYPHKDSYTTGQRGARMLLDILAGRCRPTMVLAKVPVLVGGCLGHTEGPGPFADLMRYAKQHEGRGSVVSTSVFLVHPHVDQPDMGGGCLVITDNDPGSAMALAEDVANRFWLRRRDLEPETISPQEAIRRGLAIEGGPVLLVETADCAGGGATGDSVHTIRALLEAGVNEPALAMVVDPAAAAACHASGEGATVSLTLGHSLDPQWGEPLELTGRVAKLTDGTFRYQGGIWEGAVASMGPTALLVVGSLQIVIASMATYDWADEQYRSLGLDPQQVKFIVVKNPMNYRFGYASVSRGAFILDTPGPTPATLKHFSFHRLRRPYFPADAEIPDLQPTVARSRIRF